MNTVPFNEKDVKEYLDKAIKTWRTKRNDIRPELDIRDEYDLASHYIDAFQSVRTSLFGETLKVEKVEEDPITGYLLGSEIKIDCDKNQARLIRARLEDWLDEETRRD